MKKTILLFVAIVMMAGITTKSMAQVTENIAAGANILTALTISETLPMHFGTMGVLAGQGGTCVVSTAGVRTPTAGVTLSAMAPLMSLATCEVTGEASYTYAITLPLTITVVHSTIPANTMSIGTLLAKATSGTESHTATGTLQSNGKESFTIGGTLTVAMAQKEGAYAGTFDVTVAYN
jgi:hypothetical protein